MSTASSCIQVSSALVPPQSYEQWNVSLSCHSELNPSEKDWLASIPKKSDAIIHIISYDDVARKNDSAFTVLAKVIQNNDCKLLLN